MRILLSLLVAALVLASASVAASSDFTLRRAAQTRTTVTLEWDRQRGADGYRFMRNGVVVASTLDAATTSATFWKGSRYAVELLRKRADGRMTRVKRATFRSTAKPKSRRGRAPLVFVRAPSTPFKLRVTATTPSRVTFAWRRQPGADGYRFLRNGVVVAKTLDPKTTSVTFWKGRRYAVEVLRVTRSKKTVTLRRASAYVAGGKKRRAGRLVLVPAPRVSFRLRLAARTPTKMTFAWKRLPVADGYRFMRNGVVVASTFDPSTTSVTFWKGTRYAVEVLRKAGSKEAVPITWALAYTPSASGPRKVSQKPKPGPGSAPSPQPSPGSPNASSPPSASAPGKAAPTPAQPKQPAPTKPTQPAPPSPPAPSTPPSPAPSPPPPVVGPGGTLNLTGSYSPDALFTAIALAPPGPVTVRGGFSVSGGLTITRPSLTIEDASISGMITFASSATGSAIKSSSATAFAIKGADNVLVEGNTFDGHGAQKDGGVIWDEPSGNAPSGWVIRNNVMKNFYTSDSSDHSQALYVGYSTHGLIEGNTFTKNGNTAHIFFTWFGNEANPSTSYPRNICVRGNTFNETAGAYIDVNFRAEIPSSAGIVVQPDASTDRSEFAGNC